MTTTTSDEDTEVVTVDWLLPGVGSTIPAGTPTLAVFGILTPRVLAVVLMTMSQKPPAGRLGIVPLSTFPARLTLAGAQLAPAPGVTVTMLAAVIWTGSVSLTVAPETVAAPLFPMRIR